MSSTLLPEISCNAGCTGCYMGDAFVRIGKSPRYDIEAMLATAGARSEREKSQGASLHGGEISLLPAKDLRRLVEGLLVRQYPTVTLQTNALTLTEEKMRMLASFNDKDNPGRVSVGVSLNGPKELNRDRRFGSIAQTDRATERIHRNVERLRELSINVGIITVLSKTNADSMDKVLRLIDWAKELGEHLGIWSFRFNPLGHHADKDPVTGESMTCLTEEELSVAWVRLAQETMADPRHDWLPFREFLDNLWGLGVQPCWVSGCDPYDTDAVYGINPDGSLSNCGRTAVDGFLYGRDGQQDDLRDQTLGQVPYPDGGCGGCRWWSVCHGGCPGEAVGGDWRNRSMFCGSYIRVYEFLERGMKGWLPNFEARPDWNLPPEAQQGITQRNPSRSPIQATFPGWSSHPSTWKQDARRPR